MIFRSLQKYLFEFKSGGQSNTFISLMWNQLTVSSAACYELLSFWKVHPHTVSSLSSDSFREFPGTWHHSSSFENLNSVSTVRRKIAPHDDASASELHCRYGIVRVTCRAISPSCVIVEKFFVFVCPIWHYIYPKRLLQMLCRKLQMSFNSLPVWSCMVTMAVDSIVFSMMNIPAAGLYEWSLTLGLLFWLPDFPIGQSEMIPYMYIPYISVCHTTVWICHKP